MKLSTILNDLSQGELVQLAIGNGGLGILPDDVGVLLSSINLGLTELHKRFLLREGSLTLMPLPGRASYPLLSKYQVNNPASTEPVRFIAESSEAFRDDILKIERVYDSAGNELGLNDPENPLALYTPTYNQLRLPSGLPEGNLTVVYRANHPRIEKGAGVFQPDTVEVELPESHREALLYYVAARVVSPSGMQDDFHDGNNYLAHFEASCQRLEQYNLRIEQRPGNSRLERNGWV